jgi:hypothetical protein
MRNYTKYLIYYFLAFLDSTINLLCSLIGVYPGVEMSENFLVKRELLKTNNFISDRLNQKEQKIEEAEQKASSAKSLLEDAF